MHRAQHLDERREHERDPRTRELRLLAAADVPFDHGAREEPEPSDRTTESHVELGHVGLRHEHARAIEQHARLSVARGIEVRRELRSRDDAEVDEQVGILAAQPVEALPQRTGALDRELDRERGLDRCERFLRVLGVADDLEVDVAPAVDAPERGAAADPRRLHEGESFRGGLKERDEIVPSHGMSVRVVA